MRDITDLAQAMARETADLVPRTSAEEILRGGRHRARRRTAAAAVGAVVAMALPVALLSTGGGRGGISVGAAPPSASMEGFTPAGTARAGTLPSATPGPSGTPDRPLDPTVGCPADPKNARVIGETIWTGAKNSQGEELLVRFLQNDQADTDTAGFGVGLGDRATNRVETIGCGFAFGLPPVAEGYPGISAEFDGPDFSGPDATTTIVGSFVGPADRITATYDGAPLTVKWTRWSEHPEMVVYWILGVPAGGTKNVRDFEHPLVTIYDEAGTVIARPTE